jgi:uncharacterized protein YdeI (YjbR/CyaY-like superfamily)
MDIKVKAFIDEHEKWKNELLLLRKILLELGLSEQYKWRVPVFLHEGKNIALIGAFKSHSIIGFFKGSLLKDKEKMLVSQTSNVQSSRLLTFQSLSEIELKKGLIQKYIAEAVEIEKAGLKVVFKETAEFPVPGELNTFFESDAEFQRAFYALTPGRQRGYLLHFNGAKQSSTRMDRIVKCKTRILSGKGLNDCICGKSKRMPNCDGSHKQH